MYQVRGQFHIKKKESYIGHSTLANSMVELVETFVLVGRRLWIPIPPENAYEVFHHRVLESTEYTVLLNMLERARNPQFKADCSYIKRIRFN